MPCARISDTPPLGSQTCCVPCSRKPQPHEYISPAVRRPQAGRLPASRRGHGAAGPKRRKGLLGLLDPANTLCGFLAGRDAHLQGGTSLSKAWKLIEHFSEDIDLIVDKEALGFGGDGSPDQAPSNKQRRVRLEALMAASRHWIQGHLQPKLAQSLTKALGPTRCNWDSVHSGGHRGCAASAHRADAIGGPGHWCGACPIPARWDMRCPTPYSAVPARRAEPAPNFKKPRRSFSFRQ
ncbi:MAG: nucleotidyl transferase AbiEii/AbiGii toxin family protein [Opitutaceae bacterium]|nr:nucleotidyl transferase AbiEii/AbiGii toxin family protein [Opitutaceae bacterium]